jgi:hypothetical protein
VLIAVTEGHLAGERYNLPGLAIGEAIEAGCLPAQKTVALFFRLFFYDKSTGGVSFSYAEGFLHFEFLSPTNPV